MNESSNQNCNCPADPKGRSCGSPPLEMFPMYKPEVEEIACCGTPAGPPSSPYERPGYALCSFVEGFMETQAGTVPLVKTRLDKHDWRGSFRMRLGFGRSDYKVAPGLYAVGHPDDQSPVLVTANYKLSFDHVRRNLSGLNLWMLILDTRGINVWCAAGKGTFGTQELVYRVQQTGLDRVVRHRRLILPQLGATGVAGHQVKKACGFEVLWGPVQASDIKKYLENNARAEETMRRVTFSFFERVVLVPVEVTLLRNSLLWAIGVILILSGIGPHIFSISAAWQRGVFALAAILTGILSGCAVVPALLPYIPTRAFALKGAIAGLILGALLLAGLWHSPQISLGPAVAMLLLTSASSSFLAMNFTGATPFTSPSGVEKEMRRFIPVQLAALVVAVLIWLGAAFV